MSHREAGDPRTRKPEQGAARPFAPRLPASARLCAAPGSPRARRSCRKSRTQRVLCRCGTCARAPRARAVWRTPEAGGAGERAAERGRGARTPAGRGPGGAGAGPVKPGAWEPHLAALDALVGAAAQQQAGAQQLRLHLDARAFVAEQPVAALRVQSAGGRPLVQSCRRGPEVAEEPQARAAGSSTSCAASPGRPGPRAASRSLRAVQGRGMAWLRGALAEEAQAGAALQGRARPVALHQVPQIGTRQAAPRVRLEGQGEGLSFVQRRAHRLLRGCGGTRGCPVRSTCRYVYGTARHPSLGHRGTRPCAGCQGRLQAQTLARSLGPPRTTGGGKTAHRNLK